MKQRYACLSRAVQLGLALIVALSMVQSVNANGNSSHPPIAGGVPFFYYDDLKAAADWYESQLGLKRTADKNWVVVFELTPSSYIGLVNASGGSMVPTEKKGALLSIETEALEEWYEYLKDKPGIDLIHGIEEGASGMIEEFRMKDPGGYIVEFFRWKLTPEQRLYSDMGNQ